MATTKKKTTKKKAQPLSPFTGSKQNHLRTGAKYTVADVDRTHRTPKGVVKSNSSMTQFATKKEADEYAKALSRKRENRAYVVFGEGKDYRKSVRGVYTHGRENKSLTDGLKKEFGKQTTSKEDYATMLELMK